MKVYPSQLLPRFIIRFPSRELLAELKKEAAREGRSLNAHLVKLIEAGRQASANLVR